MKGKSQVGVSNELVDEIVDEIISETKPNAYPREEHIFNNDSSELARLKVRLQNIENRIEKHIHDYRTTAIEAERQLSLKADEIEQEYQGQLTHLQSQVETLRSAMIRLGNEFRQFKESISSRER